MESIGHGNYKSIAGNPLRTMNRVATTRQENINRWSGKRSLGVEEGRESETLRQLRTGLNPSCEGRRGNASQCTNRGTR